MLEYELKYKMFDEKIKDRKAKDAIRKHDKNTKAKELMIKQQKLSIEKNNAYSKAKKNISPREVIVVYETVQNRNE